MKRIVWGLLSALCAPMPSIAADVTIQNGFITGNDFLATSYGQQHGYVVGLVEGMLLAPLFDAPRSGRLAALEKCLEGMNSTQILAIMTKWLNDHPEQWNEFMHVIGAQAMDAACSKKQ